MLRNPLLRLGVRLCFRPSISMKSGCSHTNMEELSCALEQGTDMCLGAGSAEPSPFACRSAAGVHATVKKVCTDAHINTVQPQPSHLHLQDLLRCAPTEAIHQQCCKTLRQLAVRVSTPVDAPIYPKLRNHPDLQDVMHLLVLLSHPGCLCSVSSCSNSATHTKTCRLW
jgi:hypothetical protein